MDVCKVPNVQISYSIVVEEEEQDDDDDDVGEKVVESEMKEG